MIILPFILLPLSMYAFWPSFHLGFYGDDWLEIWRFFYTTGADKYGIWGYLGYLFSRYGSFDLIMGLLVNIFGYRPVYFFATAYLLRLIAAVSFYPLVNYLTKSKIAALFACLFFSVSAVGLDATNWVFNMPVYLAIAFLNLLFYFFIRSKFEDNEKFFGLSLIFFGLSVMTAAVRMTGLLPLLILVELFWFIKDPQRKYLKQALKRIAAFLLVFILIVSLGNLIGNFQKSNNYLVGSLSNWSDIWGIGLKSMLDQLSANKTSFLLYPLIMIGNMIFPIEVTTANKWGLIISALLLFLTGVKFIISNLKNNLISTGVFLSLIWIVLSFIFAWVRSPDVLFPFTHRYLIVSVVGLTVFLSVILSLVKRYVSRGISVVFLIGLIILNVHSTRKYFNYLVNDIHGVEVSENIWSQMPYVPEVGKSNQPLVFYFEGENKGILYGVITFGFPYHMGLLYKIDDYYRMPVPMDEWKSLVSAVKDGESLKPYDQPAKPLPFDNIYAFRLEGRDRLVNITDEIRLKLSEVE